MNSYQNDALDFSQKNEKLKHHRSIFSYVRNENFSKQKNEQLSPNCLNLAHPYINDLIRTRALN